MDETAPHVTSRLLVDYYDHELSEAEVERLEVHLAECLACAEWARGANAILAVMDGWTARSHGALFSQAMVAQSLSEAATRNRPEIPDWKMRIEAWKSALSRRAREEVSGAIQAARQTSEKVATAAGHMFFPPEAWGPSLPVGQGVRTRGSEAPPTSTIRVILHREGLPEGVVVKLAIDDHMGEVEVRLDQFPSDKREAPLLLLVSRDSAAQVAQFARAQQGDYLIARFEEVGPGDYLSCFEPGSGSGK
jgi:anti-sigma factor RsiW